MRLLALLMLRDEIARLPGYFANVSPQVDGIIALDHGSIDGSAEFASGEPKLIELLTRPRGACFDDGAFRRILTEAGVRQGADWLLGIDADERIERGFRERVGARLARDRWLVHDAYALPICELWDRPDSYRVDGIWGRKLRTSLFRASEEHRFDERPLHSQWASTSGPPFGGHPRIDARIYHLTMLTHEGRLERQARYRERDPDARWQRIGYDYLTDERGLKLERISPGREYDEAIGGEEWGSAVPRPELEERGDLRQLILHHTAIRDRGLKRGDPAAEAAYMRRIERLHLERGWLAIGYHFVIMPSGRVYQGRPVWAAGAHAEGHNQGTVGIALAGDFDQERPERAAVRSLEALRLRLAPPGEPVQFRGHSDLMPTACPGRFLRAALSARAPASDLARG